MHSTNVLQKKIDTLQRRHDQLKQRYEEAVKSNKEYSKRLAEALKDNTELKEKARTDAEILTDTISVNQVLMEEIKVKNAIIEANEKLNNHDDVQNSKENQDIQETVHDVANNRNKWTNCRKCEWKSTNATLLAGHMLKHNGQYICTQCKIAYVEKHDLTLHNQENHKEKEWECEVCENTFTAEPPLKQHMSSKHRNSQSLPDGHPENIREQQMLQFNCNMCGYTSSLPYQLQNHMKEHTQAGGSQKFENPKVNKPCGYFKRGYCAEGSQSVRIQTQQTISKIHTSLQ